MAKFNSLETYAALVDSGLVPLYYSPEVDTVCDVIKACYDGGLRVFEFTNRGDYAHEVFVEAITLASLDYSDMIVGVGSVVDAPTAALYIQSGANFVVGPSFNPEVARLCNRRGVPYIPGCATATEIGEAQQAGCQIDP